MTRDETIKAIKLADELLVRRARESFSGFCKYMQPADMQPALHHLVMCEALNAAITGTAKKVMLQLLSWPMSYWCAGRVRAFLGSVSTCNRLICSLHCTIW